MPLTVKKIQSIKPSEKTIKVFDERGLYLEVPPSGGKWWRLKYRFAGKEKRLSLGVYPTPLSRVRIFGISEIAGDLWPKILIREILAAKC